jgi:UDP-4-amino-4-deoxy-L-arabinose formyltransferase/UDP-glucuronic acid dehydrogenase (UDP-4-keto-hexauronic acid decarboxylating)
MKKVFIPGVNGFIGNALAERLLLNGGYAVSGLDINDSNIKHLFAYKNFYFKKGDVHRQLRWIERQVADSNIILPLIALATPIEYVHHPLSVFELDFEENLKIVRHCVKYKKRLVFPSTSEVYGMCREREFDEDNSFLTQGPIRMQRWIYSCCKQMLDRVIWAYGKEGRLKFTIFRPFNWIGPHLDSLESARKKSSRVVTQLILDLVEGRPVALVDGGGHQRCFTDIDDGVECLFRIIEDEGKVCDGKIFNIGNPHNEITIKSLARLLIKKFERHPLRKKILRPAGLVNVKGKSFYGEGYQDILHRKPRIENARKLLGWRPSVTLSQSLDKTLDYFLRQAAEAK